MTYEKSFDTIDEFVDNISRGGEIENTMENSTLPE